VLLDSVRKYHEAGRWWCHLFLLMPDHLHALLSVPRATGMSATVRLWKSYHARINQVRWQDGYFDHRIRNTQELDEKDHYIRQNPVVKGLCGTPGDWPWVIDLKTLADE
jgi:REP element-mobilizing transposase RayT